MERMLGFALWNKKCMCSVSLDINKKKGRGDGQGTTTPTKPNHCNNICFASIHLHFYSINNTLWQESGGTVVKIHSFILRKKIYKQARKRKLKSQLKPKPEQYFNV